MSGTVTCPKCGATFDPPRIMIMTQETLDRLGPNPAKCPKCGHQWSRG